MTKVTFPAQVEDSAFLYGVTAARFRGQWILCRHRERPTWELPGGHREPGETALEAAARELREESGAERFSIVPVSPYRVDRDGSASHGLLCYAEVEALGPLGEDSEIGEVRLANQPEGDWTYPHIVPHLLERIRLFLEEGGSQAISSTTRTSG